VGRTSGIPGYRCARERHIDVAFLRGFGKKSILAPNGLRPPIPKRLREIA